MQANAFEQGTAVLRGANAMRWMQKDLSREEFSQVMSLLGKMLHPHQDSRISLTDLKMDEELTAVRV